MRKLHVFTLVASLAIFAFGCATDRNRPAITGDAQLSALTVPEGILLILDNIPPDTARLFINIQKSQDTFDAALGRHDIVSSFADIRGDSLAQVRQTGRVLFPFVQEGRIHQVTIILQNEDFQDIGDWLHSDVVAGSGIRITNEVLLHMDDARSSVTLSSPPEFSQPVSFAPAPYYFEAVIWFRFFMDGTEVEWDGSLGLGSNITPTAEGITWTFDPEIVDNLRDSEILQQIYFPPYTTRYNMIFIIARSNIIFDNIEWHVEIAKTDEFTIELD